MLFSHLEHFYLLVEKIEEEKFTKNRGSSVRSLRDPPKKTRADLSIRTASIPLLLHDRVDYLEISVRQI